MNETAAREKLASVCKMIYDRNLTVSAGGNMSIRIDSEKIIITPSGRNKGLLCADDMVTVAMDGTVIGEGKPSIETGFHLALYNKTPETGAIVHCHPIYCTSLAVSGKKIRSALTPEGILLLGDVPFVKYETPGTPELVKAIEEHHKSNAMIMERHGALTQGRDIIEAYNRMEELEFQAHLQLLVGRAKNLPQSEINKIKGV